MSRSSKTSSGVGIGCVMAMILSWVVNHSVFWCLVHACCSWLYVIYWLFVYSWQF